MPTTGRRKRQYVGRMAAILNFHTTQLYTQHRGTCPILQRAMTARRCKICQSRKQKPVAKAKSLNLPQGYIRRVLFSARNGAAPLCAAAGCPYMTDKLGVETCDLGRGMAAGGWKQAQIRSTLMFCKMTVAAFR